MFVESEVSDKEETVRCKFFEFCRKEKPKEEMCQLVCLSLTYINTLFVFFKLTGYLSVEDCFLNSFLIQKQLNLTVIKPFKLVFFFTTRMFLISVCNFY